MGKVILTKEQAEAIEKIKSGALRIMSAKEIYNALAYSYEVEPEYSAGDWVWIRHHELAQLTEFITHNDGDTNWAGNVWCDFRKNNHEIAIKHNEIKRHATPSEIAEEKERRWWRKHGRDVWELKQDDLLLNKFDGYISTVNTVFKGTVSFDDGLHVPFDKMKRSYKVICFAENRLDVKINE